MQRKPILLFNNECAVCRRIARWIARSVDRDPASARILEQPIGDDPEALRQLNPNLDIWDAYATVHVLMPDGSMKVGGEAVAEVLRDLPNTRWFAWCFSVEVLGIRPFQALLDLAYVILADVRPLLGCESCGSPHPLLRPIQWIVRGWKSARRALWGLAPSVHSSPLPSQAKLAPATRSDLRTQIRDTAD